MVSSGIQWNMPRVTCIYPILRLGRTAAKNLGVLHQFLVHFPCL